MSTLCGFVVQCNRRTGDLRVNTHASVEDAMDERLELESARTDMDIEIDLLVADSIDTIQRTHSRYFMRRQVTS